MLFLPFSRDTTLGGGWQFCADGMNQFGIRIVQVGSRLDMKCPSVGEVILCIQQLHNVSRPNLIAFKGGFVRLG